MSSNTPDNPGGYPNYPPQSDQAYSPMPPQPNQGYGPAPTPSYGSGWPPSPPPAGASQPASYLPAQQPSQELPPAASYTPPSYYTDHPEGSSPNPTPAQRSRRGLWIGLAALVVVVLLLAGGAVVYSSYQNGEAARPVAAANAFCQALETQNYTAAYGMLSSAYTAKLSQADFTQANQLHDQLDGKVKDCSVQAPSPAGFSFTHSTAADLSAKITRNKTFSGGISLIKQGDNWKVNAIDASLQGTDVGALAVAQNFCTALAAKNYAAAYADFSPTRQQAIGSQTDYANAMKANFGGNGVSITGCKMRLDTYSVAPADDAASITMELNVKVSTASSGSQVQAVPLKITFAKTGGQWKIDDAEVSA